VEPRKKKDYLRNKEVMIAFGKNLRAIREKKDISMQALADLCNIEYSQVSRIERGLINTSLSAIFTLASVLEVPMKRLLDFEMNSKKKKK
jgi:transcriptional regulator with XRE-family HTH domain